MEKQWQTEFKYQKKYDAGFNIEVGKTETPYFCPKCQTVGFDVFAHSENKKVIGCAKCGVLMEAAWNNDKWDFVPFNATSDQLLGSNNPYPTPEDYMKAQGMEPQEEDATEVFFNMVVEDTLFEINIRVTRLKSMASD